MKKDIVVWCFSLLCIINNLYSQDYPYDVPQYPFIKYDKNKLIGNLQQSGFQDFYTKWEHLIRNGTQQIEVLHIGDSHIQADFFTGRIRTRMQHFFPGLEGARGIIFPYNLAKTNNPSNYRIYSKNNWSVINGVKTKNRKTGIIPAKIFCADSLITLRIKQYDYSQYSGYNKLEIWYATGNLLHLITPEGRFIDILPGTGRLSMSLSNMVKDSYVQIIGASEQNAFELFGICLKNELPGITYHSLGLNGAKAENFAQSEGLTHFLQYITPDVIVVSLGTNDIYGEYTKTENFTLNMEQLLRKIRLVYPHKALILTTPPDHCIHGFISNEKVPQAVEILKQLGHKFNAAIWDFYEIMGGKNSMVDWEFNGLSAKDRVHLSKKGYFLQGDLFFIALLRGFENVKMLKE